jgi:hypothetical protein
MSMPLMLLHTCPSTTCLQIHDNAVLNRCLVCDKAVIKPGAQLSSGSIVSYGVVIGAGHVVPPYARISLCQQLQSMVGGGGAGLMVGGGGAGRMGS